MCSKQVTQTFAFSIRFFTFLSLVSFISTAVPAAVTSTGDISPNLSKWNLSTNGSVGFLPDSTGTIEVNGGSLLTSAYGYLGLGLKSTGTATVTGTDSKWINSRDLNVGYGGSGTLKIEAGGEVSNGVGCLGRASTGTATVTGTGSKWSNSDNLNVGYDGTGTLKIEAGGMVSNTFSHVGYNPGSTGTAIVTGQGSKWINNRDLYVGLRGSGTLKIEAGGEVSNGEGCLGMFSGSTGTATVTGTGSKWINSRDLNVGYGGSGTLKIEAGGDVRTDGGCLGMFSGSTGMVTVTGPGSKWNNSSLGVGRSGSGTLIIEAGGEVISYAGTLGSDSGSTGTVTVIGPNSKWKNTYGLYVGFKGNGSLTVADGGVVTTQTLYASLSDLHGNGTISTNGVILDTDLVFDASHGPQQTFSFGAGGQLNFNLDGNGNLGVGHKGSGTLLVAEGRAIVSSNGLLGNFSGSTGTATVTGPGSKWTNRGDLRIGPDFSPGSSSLTITNGGLVTASPVSINPQSEVVLDVGTGSQLVINTGNCVIVNNGIVRLLAGAGIPTGKPAVKPIAATSWDGTGKYQAVGGKWNASSHEFTVSPVQEGNVGTPVSMDLVSTQRALITGPTGAVLGASFLESSASQMLTFTASTLNGDQLTSLQQKLDTEGSSLLSGWSFTDISGYTADSPVYLSFDVGLGRDATKLELWKNTTTGWSKFTTDDFVYRDKYASFCVTSLGDYAVAVPEPSTLLLLAIAGLALVAFRRRLR